MKNEIMCTPMRYKEREKGGEGEEEPETAV